MLVLTRYIAESLCIGSDIPFAAPKINGNQLRIDTQALTLIAIDLEKIRRKKLNAGM